MDRYTIDSIKAAICRELDEIAHKGLRTHEDLDITKDLVETYKNLEDIEMNSSEEYGNPDVDMRKYSQRGNNYRMGNYSQRNYNTYYGRNSYTPDNNMGMSMADGNMPYTNGNYLMGRSYTGPEEKSEVIKELHQMVQNTSDEQIKKSILDCISKMEK